MFLPLLAWSHNSNEDLCPSSPEFTVLLAAYLVPAALHTLIQKSPSATLLFPHTPRSCLSNSVLTSSTHVLSPRLNPCLLLLSGCHGKDGEFVSKDEGSRRYRHHGRRTRTRGRSSIHQSTLSPRNTPRRWSSVIHAFVLLVWHVLNCFFFQLNFSRHQACKEMT